MTFYVTFKLFLRVSARWFGVHVSLHAEILEPHASTFNHPLTHYAKPYGLEKGPSRDTDLGPQVPDGSAYGHLRDRHMPGPNFLPGIAPREIETSRIFEFHGRRRGGEIV